MTDPKTHAPAPAVPDDVAEPWRMMLRQAEDDLRKAHAAIEAQAAELARLRGLLGQARITMPRGTVYRGLKQSIDAALTHPTGGSND